MTYRQNDKALRLQRPKPMAEAWSKTDTLPDKCGHEDRRQIKPGKMRCKACGCTIYETFADYCSD